MRRTEETYPAATWAAAIAGDLRHAAMTGDDIVASEAAGTRAVVTGDTIPRRGSTTPEEVDLLTRLGFVLGDNADELFRFAALPPGWSKEASREDHRTTILRDARGCERGAIWYKAAFYDRDAYMVLHPRFRLTEWPGDSTTARDWQSRTRRAVVLDQGCVVFASGTYQRPDGNGGRAAWLAYEDDQRRTTAEALAWLAAHWPAYEDTAAYWD